MKTVDIPQFDPAQYMAEYRGAMTDEGTKVPLYGNARLVHRPILAAYDVEAVERAHDHIIAARADVPELQAERFSRFQASYVADYRKLVRQVTLGTLRMAHAGNTAFADMLEVESNRSAVLERLGRDIRVAALYGCDKRLKNLSAKHFLDSFLSYYDPSYAKELYRDKRFAKLPRFVISRALKLYGDQPVSYLNRVIANAEDLSNNLELKGAKRGLINQAAIFHMRDPQGVAGNRLARQKELAADPRFESWGVGVLEIAATYSDPEAGEAFLIEAAKQKARLKGNPHYAKLSDYALNIAVTRNSPDPEGFLNTVLSLTTELEQDTRLSMFSPSQIRRAVIGSPEDAKTNLVEAAQTYTTMSVDPEYADFGLYWLKRVIIDSPKLEAATTIMDGLIAEHKRFMSDERVAIYGANLIKRIVIDAANPTAKMREIIKAYDKLRQDPASAEFTDAQLRRAAVRNPRQPKPRRDTNAATGRKPRKRPQQLA